MFKCQIRSFLCSRYLLKLELQPDLSPGLSTLLLNVTLKEKSFYCFFLTFSSLPPLQMKQRQNPKKKQLFLDHAFVQKVKSYIRTQYENFYVSTGLFFRRFLLHILHTFTSNLFSQNENIIVPWRS